MFYPLPLPNGIFTRNELNHREAMSTENIACQSNCNKSPRCPSIAINFDAVSRDKLDFSGYLIYVRQLNVDDCSCGIEKRFSRNKFSLLQWRAYFVLISPSSWDRASQSRQSETPWKFSLSLNGSGLQNVYFALIAIFLLRCGGILRERRLMLELLRIIGTIHKQH